MPLDDLTIAFAIRCDVVGLTCGTNELIDQLLSQFDSLLVGNTVMGGHQQEQLKRRCIMCGALPGTPCKVIYGDPHPASPSPSAGLNPGDERPEPHFYR